MHPGKNQQQGNRRPTIGENRATVLHAGQCVYCSTLAVGLLLTGLVLLIWAAKKYPHRKIPL